MDYYEELGIDRSATDEDIRRAHRRLTKLLHPDQQTDEAVKQLAETQMRRLNSIVETLSDPQRRRDYDEELRRGVQGFAPGKLRRRAFHSWPWWVGSTIGAVVLTVGAVWFSAEKWGSSFGDHAPTYIPSGAETSSDPNRTSTLAEAPPAPAPTRTQESTTPAETDSNKPLAITDSQAPAEPSTTVANVPAPELKSEPANQNQVATRGKSQTGKVQPEALNPTVVVAEVPRRKTLTLPLTHVAARAAAPSVTLPAAPGISTPGPGHIEAEAIPPANLPSPPKLAEPKAVSAPKVRDALEGEWVYAPTEPEKRKVGFYPPEYIDLKIWNEGGLRGEYRARYHITGKPIPPDVSFALAPDGNPRHFTWSSSNGSKGTLKVNSMDAASIRIEWRTTVFSPTPALTAGTATLVRRTP